VFFSVVDSRGQFKEGGNGASVKKIDSSDNRGAGSSIGQQCRGVACGTQVKIVVK
jgi:hypothetical protein